MSVLLRLVIPIFLVRLLVLGFIPDVFADLSADIGISVAWRQAYCNDGGDNDGDFLIDFSADNQCSSVLDDDENVTGAESHATRDFTIAGGSYTSFTNGNGLAVDFSFPANFYTESVRLFANSYANGFFDTNKPAPSGKSFIGKTYDFLFYVLSSGASLVSTNSAITITLRYNDSDASSVSESNIAGYVWGASDTAWQAISGSTVNTSSNTVTFSTVRSGSFALFGSAAATTTPEAVAAPYPGSGGAYQPRRFIPAKPAPPCPTIDFNCDGKVNVQDLSMMLYWWDKPREPYDLNRDGAIDIQDISILMYYWTE